MKTLKRLVRMMPIILGIIFLGFCLGSPIDHCCRVGGIIAAMTVICGAIGDYIFEEVLS